jgi:hypothetical protein
MINELLGNPFRDSFYIGLYLGWVVNILGLVVCFRGFTKTNGKAFLLIAIFFTQPLLGIVYHQVEYRLNKEEIDQYIKIKNQELQERMERGEIIEVDSTINLPVFEAVLVLGLFFQVRNRNLVEPVGGADRAR